MNVKEIIKEYLIKNGYDGLFTPGECACRIEDLCPRECDSFAFCEPGHESECDCGEHSFHIGT